MNAYTETLMKLASGQNYFHRKLVERLMEEHRNIRRQNAALRDSQVKPVIDGVKYELAEHSKIEPAPLDISDDEVLFFKPVPVVILREVE